MHNTIIIGAGAAGLAAGQALAAAGRPALLVEARERLGGRIHTDFTHGPVELGAEFIHGDLAATWEYVRSAGLRTSRWGRERQFALGGHILRDDDPLAALVFTLYEQVATYSGPELSAEALLRRLADPDDPALGIVLRWLANLEGANTTVLSAPRYAWEREHSYNGEDNFHLLDGYGPLIAQMAAGLDIRLNTVVHAIGWGRDGAKLLMADGTTLAAHHVIVTVPIGVLQAGRPIFTPALPTTKQEAIAAIPMGHVTKLVLWFDRQFWPDFTVLSTDGRIATWWPVESAATPTLMGYQGGNVAQTVAAMGVEHATAIALAELEQLFGVDPRPHLLGSRLANWMHDPWSLGAYTYSGIGMGEARATLAAPLDGTLFFAGEATVLDGHIATVHGAIESGRRAAAEVLAAG